MLANVFSKYPSFAKAKVVRTKRTMKTKGYGFVSFLDVNDFIAAFKDMNGVQFPYLHPMDITSDCYCDRQVRRQSSHQASEVDLEGQKCITRYDFMYYTCVFLS